MTSPSGIQPAAAGKPLSPSGKDTIARLLVQQGLISPKQSIYAKRVQNKLISSRSRIGVFKELNLLTDEQLVSVLNVYQLDIRIGELLVELGDLRNEDLESALTIQRESAQHRKVGDILVEYGFVDEVRIIEILASKLGYPFVVPEFAKIDRDLLRQVPQKVFFSTHVCACFVPGWQNPGCFYRPARPGST